MVVIELVVVAVVFLDVVSSGDMVVFGVEEGTTTLVRFCVQFDCCAKNLMHLSDVNSFV